MSLKNRLAKIEDRMTTYINREVLFFDGKIGAYDAERYSLPLDISMEDIMSLKEDYEILHFLGGELYWTGQEEFDLQGNMIGANT